MLNKSDTLILTSCGDEDITIVSNEEGYCRDLDVAIQLEKSLVIIKSPDIARDVKMWLQIGHRCRIVIIGISCTSAISYCVSERWSKALSITSLILSCCYTAIWHSDPIFANYHVLDDERLLTYLGVRYRRGTNVVLIRNTSGILHALPFLTCAISLGLSFGRCIQEAMHKLWHK